MSVTLTERAAAHVRSFLAGRRQAAGLRIGVKKTGCSGHAYVVEVAESVGAHDQIFESQGVKLVVDREALDFLDGTELDYVREGLNETFKFNNPNVKATCGCGESFTT